MFKINDRVVFIGNNQYLLYQHKGTIIGLDKDTCFVSWDKLTYAVCQTTHSSVSYKDIVLDALL